MASPTEDQPKRYVLDACVLYPVVLRDLLLTLAIESAFVPVWSDEIIDEMRRNVLADLPGITAEQFDKATTTGMRSYFPASFGARLRRSTDEPPPVAELGWRHRP